MSIEKLMQRQVQAMSPTETCSRAAQLMRDARVGAVVVVEEGVPLGVVTDRDLVLRLIAEGRDPAEVELRAIMSRHPAFVSKERSLDDAIRTMREMGVRRLPIVDEHGRVVGMLSLDDVLMVLAAQLGFLGEAVRNELVGLSR